MVWGILFWGNLKNTFFHLYARLNIGILLPERVLRFIAGFKLNT
jgi:hypothetical protein